MSAHEELDLAGWNALAFDLCDRIAGELAGYALQCRARFLAEPLFDRLLADAADIGEAHAVSREQRRQRMDQHTGHTERIGDQTGVLAAGAAEAIERVARNIVAALHRDFFDRVGHVLDGDPDEAVGDLLGAALVADLFRHGGKCVAHRIGVERLVLPRSKNLRKEIGNKLADHDVGVGHRQRAAAAVAFRAGIGAGRVRPNAKSRTVEMQNRTAAGRDGVE